MTSTVSSEPAQAERKRPHFGTVVLRRPSFGGLVGALVFFWFSLPPSLLPRWWVMQAVITGLGVAIGYLIGTTVGRVTRSLVGLTSLSPMSPAVRRVAWIALGVAFVAAAIIGLGRWVPVQNASRDLVGLEHVGWFTLVPMVLLSVVIFMIAFLLGRITFYLVKRAEFFAQRFMPRWLAWVVTVVLFALIVGVLSVDVIGKGMVNWADARFGAADSGTPPDVTQPMSPLVSGSPESIVAWDSLGYEGRNFVAGAPSLEAIESFTGSGTATEPIRVYAGLDSALSLEAAAALVVDELDRTGAANRAVVVSVTTTGTGWVDPDAARALELMHAGDTAIAAMQYSFLPSWIQFLVGTELAGEAGVAINTAVIDWWEALPEPRPQLILFGESLGSLGLETAMAAPNVDASLANLTQASGALMTGPTASNPIWQEILTAREDDSPVWRPLYDAGTTVRVANLPEDPERVGSGQWEKPRALYFHHPSDPVGYWDLATMWSRPEWVNDPVGYDVSPDVGWFPILTWGQVSADLMAGFSAGPGFGHNYSIDFVSGWAAVVPPSGWSEADTQALEEHLRPGIDAESSE